MRSSRNAAMFISLMAASGFTILVKAALGMRPMHHFPFLSLLALALLTARWKVRLPGLTGNMSVNLPFLFLAIVQLSLLEAAVIAFASTLVQSLPKRNKPLKVVQVLFNVSTVTTAAGCAYLVFHNPVWRSGPNASLSLVLAAGTYFFVNTLPVATIITLTEGVKLIRTWGGILQLSFPYYVAGTGITSMITGKGGYAGWALPLAALPVMLGIYRSYRIYFGEAALAGSKSPDASSTPAEKSRAVGAS
jgi:hypothetical protein